MPNIELKLFPNFVTIIVQLLSTGVLFLLFKKYLWKYVLDFMDKRADAIEKNINDAKDMREKATVYLQESEEQARASAKQYREIIDLAKEDANKAKQQIMTFEMKEEIVDIATEVATKIMQKDMDASTNDDMVKSFVDEVIN